MPKTQGPATEFLVQSYHRYGRHMQILHGEGGVGKPSSRPALFLIPGAEENLDASLRSAASPAADCFSSVRAAVLHTSEVPGKPFVYREGLRGVTQERDVAVHV